MENNQSKLSRINKKYSSLLLHHPWAVITGVSVFAIVLLFAGLVCTELPDFSDPSKGFFARGTGTMTGKLLIIQELVDRLKNTNNINNSPNTHQVSPEGMCVDDSNNPILDQVYDDGRECIIFWNTKESSLLSPILHITPFSKECLMVSGQFRTLASNVSLNSAYRFNKCNKIPSLNTAYEFYFKATRKIQFTPLMKHLCVKDLSLYKRFKNSGVADSNISCHYSLPGIAADFFNHTDCSYISDAEWELFSSLLDQCIPLARSGVLHVLYKKRAFVGYQSMCDHPCFSDAMMFALNMAMDKHYDVGENIKNIGIWIPLSVKPTGKSVKLEMNNMEYDDDYLKLESVNMANSRILLAMQSIRSDMYLIVLAISSILIISLMYTKSIAVCLVTVYNVLLALGCAYSTYQLVFRIKIFPYINLMGSFLLVGLSCDNVFVFDDIWLHELLRSDTVASDPLNILGHTLRHAIIALFITSCTTSAAFFTNLLSRIVYIKLFGLYLGLSIIYLFVVSVTILPAALVITHQKTEDTGETHPPKQLNSKPTINRRIIRSVTNLICKKTPAENIKPSVSIIHNIEHAYTYLQNLIFKKVIPDIIIGNSKLLSLVFTLFGIAGLVAVFVWPRMKFPRGNRQKFFTRNDDLMEYFEFHTRDEMRTYSDVYMEDIKYPQFLFIFGVSGEDNVKFLNPETKPGIIPSDPPLSMFDPLTLIYLDQFVCNFLNSSLFVGFDSLYTQWNMYRLRLSSTVNTAAIDLHTQICSNRDNFCFGPPEDIERKYRKLRSDISSKPNKMASISNELQMFLLEQNDFHMIAFVIRANHTFNQFESTDKFIKSVNRRLALFQSNSPPQFRHVWYASRTLAVFDMQRLIGLGTFQSLIASVVIVAIALFLTTVNPLITFMSIITITFILADTIAVFVLSGWTLNFMETIIIITAVGLSVDFTVHYGVAFLHAPEETGQQLSCLGDCCLGQDHESTTDNQPSQKNKKEANLRAAIYRVGPAVLMSALTTFLAGFSMSPSRLTSFSQMGFFLMLIMIISWTFATFFFLPLCLLFGPTQHWSTTVLPRYISCVRSMFKSRKKNTTNELLQ